MPGRIPPSSRSHPGQFFIRESGNSVCRSRSTRSMNDPAVRIELSDPLEATDDKPGERTTPSHRGSTASMRQSCSHVAVPGKRPMLRLASDADVDGEIERSGRRLSALRRRETRIGASDSPKPSPKLDLALFWRLVNFPATRCRSRPTIDLDLDREVNPAGHGRGLHEDERSRRTDGPRQAATRRRRPAGDRLHPHRRPRRSLKRRRARLRQPEPWS